MLLMCERLNPSRSHETRVKTSVCVVYRIHPFLTFSFQLLMSTGSQWRVLQRDVSRRW